eukprot:CAMPEP_0197603440 /NCGR_PEP_ID=MMETSP1326-20131121/39238_1 /TAXON_ID=1155430 /ORGANISM="Genus nov. species nov., Strain RCC2288" /LENGTH=153 /DNA_ID=CAMNT_0043170947 /DNA_START=23 /DNA_END=479 /DNA_ORIENTATION=-
MREVARLQGFPETFHFDPDRGYHELGNAVVPPLVRSIGAAVLEALRSTGEAGSSGPGGGGEVGVDGTFLLLHRVREFSLAGTTTAATAATTAATTATTTTATNPAPTSRRAVCSSSVPMLSRTEPPGPPRWWVMTGVFFIRFWGSGGGGRPAG